MRTLCSESRVCHLRLPAPLNVLPRYCCYSTLGRVHGIKARLRHTSCATDKWELARRVHAQTIALLASWYARSLRPFDVLPAVLADHHRLSRWVNVALNAEVTPALRRARFVGTLTPHRLIVDLACPGAVRAGLPFHAVLGKGYDTPPALDHVLALVFILVLRGSLHPRPLHPTPSDPWSCPPASTGPSSPPHPRRPGERMAYG